jgi:hypothetical protein
MTRMPPGQRPITDFFKLRPELAALAPSSYAPDRGVLWTHGVSQLRGVRSVATWSATFNVKGAPVGQL